MIITPTNVSYLQPQSFMFSKSRAYTRISFNYQSQETETFIWRKVIVTLKTHIESILFWLDTKRLIIGIDQSQGSCYMTNQKGDNSSLHATADAYILVGTFAYYNIINTHGTSEMREF